jgi:ABC-type glycerol-3-phosphate transport system permease component
MPSGSGKGWATVAVNVILLAIGVAMLYPFAWMIASSLKPNAEIYGSASLIPSTFRWSNYRDGWYSIKPYTYARFYGNTGILVLACTVGALLSSSLVGYGFARIRFRGRNVLFMLLLSTMMLPGQVTLIPMYIAWARTGFLGTYVPLIFPAFTAPAFYTFFVRQFMVGIPKELDESAVIDGAGHFKICTKIVLPLCRPVLFVIGMYSFEDVYRDFYTQLIYISKPLRYTITIALQTNIATESLINWAGILAMTFVSMIPLILVFIVAQKNLTQGIALTGIKA